jgi:hypothetical protein
MPNRHAACAMSFVAVAAYYLFLSAVAIGECVVVETFEINSSGLRELQVTLLVGTC